MNAVVRKRENHPDEAGGGELSKIASETAFLFGIVCLPFILCGCGGGQAAKIQSAQESFSDAIAFVQQGQHAEALPILDLAIAGGLNADQLEEAYLLRAECQLASGNFEAALKDLDLIQPNAAEPHRVHLLRARVFMKQNERIRMQDEIRAAQVANPTVAIPSDLQ